MMSLFEVLSNSLAWLTRIPIFYLTFLEVFGGTISYYAGGKLNAISYD